MQFTPLKQRLQDLPLILVGPILRHVDRTSVSVWLVTRAECEVTLKVARVAKPTEYFTGTVPKPTMFGRDLYITLIQAVSTTPMAPGELYEYSLSFKVGTKLRTLAEASGPNLALNYPGFTGPSFLTCPDTIEDVQIIHGSCRKPHGPDRDALAIVDVLLAESGLPNKPKRPCQLVLTGDQIYADDVADDLLAMIQDASDTLIGEGVEALPDIGLARSALPGTRAKKITAAGFTAGIPDLQVARSHLMAFGEYLLMYCFAWSDALWPPDSEFAPQGDEVVASLKIFRRDLPAVRRALANIPTYMIFDDHDVTDDWNISRDWCVGVYGGGGITTKMGLVAAKYYPQPDGKPLAPIPDLGRRIVLNALSAYTVCQAWGNEPAKYSKDSSGELLIKSIAERARGNPALEDAIGDYLLPPKVNPIGASGALESPSKSLGRSRWAFALDRDKWEMVFLDTRTERGWRNSGNAEERPTPPALVSAGRLKDQIGQLKGRQYAFIVSPAPVLGVQLAEVLQARVSTTLEGSLENDFEAWSSDMQALASLLADASATIGSASATIGSAPRVAAILSGDVHYGFSFRLRLFEGHSAARGTIFTQFTSSSLRNRDPGVMTKLLGAFGGGVHDLFDNQGPVTSDKATHLYLFDNPHPGEPIATFAIETFDSGPKSISFDSAQQPAMVLHSKTTSLRSGRPLWQGPIELLIDEGPIDLGLRGPIAPWAGVYHGKKHLERDWNRVVVHQNNVAVVGFASGTVLAKPVELTQTLWSFGEDGGTVYTKHVASIKGDS